MENSCFTSNIGKAKYPTYCCHQSRLNTFAKCSLSEKIKHEMAKAGFFYMKHNDQVFCFYCGKYYDQWRDVKDPWQVHVFLMRQCYYLIKIKGEDYAKETYNYFHNKLFSKETKEEILGQSSEKSDSGVSCQDSHNSLDDARKKKEHPDQEILKLGRNSENIQEDINEDKQSYEVIHLSDLESTDFESMDFENVDFYGVYDEIKEYIKKKKQGKINKRDKDSETSSFELSSFDDTDVEELSDGKDVEELSDGKENPRSKDFKDPFTEYMKKAAALSKENPNPENPEAFATYSRCWFKDDVEKKKKQLPSESVKEVSPNATYSKDTDNSEDEIQKSMAKEITEMFKKKQNSKTNYQRSDEELKKSKEIFPALFEKTQEPPAIYQNAHRSHDDIEKKQVPNESVKEVSANKTYSKNAEDSEDEFQKSMRDIIEMSKIEQEFENLSQLLNNEMKEMEEIFPETLKKYKEAQGMSENAQSLHNGVEENKKQLPSESVSPCTTCPKNIEDSENEVHKSVRHTINAMRNAKMKQKPYQCFKNMMLEDTEIYEDLDPYGLFDQFLTESIEKSITEIFKKDEKPPAITQNSQCSHDNVKKKKELCPDIQVKEVLPRPSSKNINHFDEDIPECVEQTINEMVRKRQNVDMVYQRMDDEIRERMKKTFPILFQKESSEPLPISQNSQNSHDDLKSESVKDIRFNQTYSKNIEDFETAFVKGIFEKRKDLYEHCDELKEKKKQLPIDGLPMYFENSEDSEDELQKNIVEAFTNIFKKKRDSETSNECFNNEIRESVKQTFDVMFKRDKNYVKEPQNCQSSHDDVEKKKEQLPSESNVEVLPHTTNSQNPENFHDFGKETVQSRAAVSESDKDNEVLSYNNLKEDIEQMFTETFKKRPSAISQNSQYSHDNIEKQRSSGANTSGLQDINMNDQIDQFYDNLIKYIKETEESRKATTIEKMQNPKPISPRTESLTDSHNNIEKEQKKSADAMLVGIKNPEPSSQYVQNHNDAKRNSSDFSVKYNCKTTPMKTLVINGTEYDYEPDLLCLVCNIKKRDVFFNPCYHVVTCSKCAEKLNSLCPICLHSIETMMPITI